MRIVVALILACAPVTAAGERLTLEWVFSDEGKTAASVPEVAWLEKGGAVIYDRHPARAQRTLEALDPETGVRSQLVDAARAIASLNQLARPKEPIDELGWPEVFHPQGQSAAYARDDAVYLLDLARSTFTRVGREGAVVRSPRYSPDGTRLAFVQDNDLWVRDLALGSDRRLTTDGSETLLNGTLSWVYWEEVFSRQDRGYAWAPDSMSIAYLQTDESPVDRVSFVDFEPDVPRVVVQRYPKAGRPNPRVRAGVLCLDSGNTTWVDLGVYPYEYLVRFTWLPDGKRLAVQTLDRSQTTADLFVADAASGQAAHLLRETDPGWVNLHDDLRLLEKRDELLWASERDGWAHLYRYDLAGRPLGRVTRGEWALRSSGGRSWLRQAVAHVDEAGGLVYFTALEKSSIERHLYRIGLDGSGMMRLTDQDGTHRVTYSPDGRYYFDAFSAVDRMPSLTLHRADGRPQHTVSKPRLDLVERFELRPLELFTIAATDGFAMPAMLIRPRGFDPRRRYPVVIYVYGGPSAPTVVNAWGGGAADYYHQMLADHGMAVLLVDNRCATAQSKTLENLVARDGYGTTELSDLLDAVRWLKSQGWVDAERVGIWGWSGGGSFTLLAMTRSREFRAGVAVAAVSDWRYYDTKWTEAFMRRPDDDPEGYESTSHALRAKQLHGRLLLVHGTHDDNVHPQNAWRFTNELIQAGIRLDMMIYPQRKHGIEDDAAQKHLYATMLEFWRRNLGDGCP
jgi:dipeptidyl-peptidase 4